MKLRIKFEKKGAVRFIGHLDILRYFQKAFSRAGYDMTFTQGFHPHPVLSFASPLGLGLESCAEYLDTEVNSCLDTDTMRDLLNAQMAEGIRIVNVRILTEEAQNSMSVFAAADYEVSFLEKEAVIGAAQIDALMKKESIPVLKKTKKSETVIDIRPMIYELRLTEDGDKLFMKLRSGSSSNLKPELVLNELCILKDIPFDPFSYRITRLEMYAQEKESTKLVPLDSFETQEP